MKVFTCTSPIFLGDTQKQSTMWRHLKYFLIIYRLMTELNVCVRIQIDERSTYMYMMHITSGRVDMFQLKLPPYMWSGWQFCTHHRLCSRKLVGPLFAKSYAHTFERPSNLFTSENYKTNSHVYNASISTIERMHMYVEFPFGDLSLPFCII